MNDDLERLIIDSLDERGTGAASGAAGSAAGIDAVFHRVGRRRARRRAVAAVGSVALVGVGVVAIAALGDEQPFVPAAPPESASLAGALGGEWAEFVPAGTPLWKCSGPVAYSDADGSSYWAGCESVTLPEDVGVFPNVVPTTVYVLDDCFVSDVAPATSVPVPHPTTVPGESSATSVHLVEWTVPCEYPPVTTAPAAEIPTTTSVWCESYDGAVTVTVPCATIAPDEISMGEQRHVVVPGDSLMVIAERYGITMQVIVDYNAWPDGLDHLLLPDDEILIPPGAVSLADR